MYMVQVMGLLQVVVNTAASKLNRQTQSELASASSQNLSGNEAASDVPKDSPSLDVESNQADKSGGDGVSISDGQRSNKMYDIILQLPQPDLHNLSSLLGHEGYYLYFLSATNFISSFDCFKSPIAAVIDY